MTRRILLLLGFVVSLTYTQAQNSTACPSPTDLFASVRDTIASLNWKSSSTTAAFTIQYKLKSDSIWKTENATINTLTLKGLKPCSEYQFKVKSVCSLTASSAFSDVKIFKTSGCSAPCLSPREITGVSEDNKITFKWAASNSIAYEVQYQDASNNGNWISARVSVPTFAALNLKPCTKYNFRVRSVCSTSSTTGTILFSDWSSSVTVATSGCVITRCVTPRIKVAVESNGVSVKWDSVRGVTYDLQVKSLRDSSWRTISNISGNSYTFLAGLASCTVYEIRIKANCTGTNNGGWGYPTRFSTLGCQPICLAPREVKAVVSDSVAVISWAGLQTTKFVLQYRLETDSLWKTVNTSTGNVHVLTGLARCKKYEVRVKAACSSTLFSDYSSTIKFETSGCFVECIIPRQLVARTVDSLNAGYLTWSSTGARAYIVEFRNMQDSSENWKRDTVFTNSMIVKNLAKCSKYGFRVRAICSNKITSASELFVFATGGCPEPCVLPIGLKNEIVDNIAYFAWAGVATGKYEIQYRLATDSTWTSVYTQGIEHKLELQRCKVYIWRVRKVCTEGVSAWSDLMKFETRGCPVPCILPIDLRSEVLDSSVNIIWSGAIDGKYEIQYRLYSDSSWSSVTTQILEHKLVLKPCAIYVWRVRKICADGSASDWSGLMKFETKGCVIPTCLKPINLGHQLAADTTAYVNWAGEAGLYEVQYRLAVDSSATAWKSVTTQEAAAKLYLQPCKLYVWRVRKICSSALTSDWSDLAKIETKGCLEPCVLPINLTNEIVDSAAYFFWAGTLGKYEIQYRLYSDSSWTSVYTQALEHKLVLQPCKVYVWRVRKVCVTGMSDWSPLMKFETRGCVIPTCLKPLNLAHTLVSDTIASINWAGEVGQYEVQYRLAADTSASPWKSISTQDFATRLILQPCKIYVWRVRKICSPNLVSDWSDFAKIETKGCLAPICSRPLNLAHTLVSDTIASINWAGEVGQYEVQYRLAADSSTTAWKSVLTQDFATRLTLQSCKIYVWRVRKICSPNLVSDWSDFAKIETKGCIEPCVLPINLAHQVADSAAYLFWAGALGQYEVQYHISGDSTWTSAYTQALEHKLILKPCKVYEWRVRKICLGTVSDWSATLKFETGGCIIPCDQPLDLRTEVTNDTIASFYWTGLIGKYELQYRPATTTAADTTWKTVITQAPIHKMALPRCQIYMWRVRKVCDNNISNWVDGNKFETTGCNVAACEVPAGLVADITQDTVAFLTWPGTLVKYDIQYRVAGTTNNDWVTITISSAGAKVRGLKRCTAYEWKVRKYCATGISDWSAIARFETKGCPVNVCPAPTNVSINQSLDFVGVTWATTSASDTVYVEYALSSDTLYRKLIGTTPNGVMLTGLLPCSVYKIKVYRQCADGSFSAAVVQELKTTGANCIADGGNTTYNLKMSNVVKNVAVSPNPGSDYIQVQYDLTETADVKIQLVNLQGQVVKQLNSGNLDSGNYAQYIDNLSDINQGMYFVIIRSNGKIMSTQKWTKQ